MSLYTAGLVRPTRSRPHRELCLVRWVRGLARAGVEPPFRVCLTIVDHGWCGQVGVGLLVLRILWKAVKHYQWLKEANVLTPREKSYVAPEEVRRVPLEIARGASSLGEADVLPHGVKTCKPHRP
jgi:hypothetical protein